MPSEYATPVLDYISLATTEQQQQHQSSSSSSPSTLSMSMSTMVPMLVLSPTPSVHLNLNSNFGSSSSLPLPPQPPPPPHQPQPQLHPPQSQSSAQTKMCPVCHCALIPENSDVVNVQGVPNIACTACIASEVLLRQQQHRRSVEESAVYHSVSDGTAPLLPEAQAPPAAAPPLQRIPAIPTTPHLSLPSRMSSVVSINMPTSVSTTTPVESQQHVTQPVGDNDERRDDTMTMMMNKDCQSENDGELDDDDDDGDDERVVQDSLGLGHRPSHGNTSELDSALDLLDSGSGSGSLAHSLIPTSPSSSFSSSSSQSQQAPHLPPPSALVVVQARQQSSLTRALFDASPSAAPKALNEEEAGTVMTTVTEAETETEPIAHAHITRSSSPPSSSSKPQSMPFPSSSSSSSKTKPYHKYLDPDPLMDISRLRARCHTHDCLYPGAQFCGTQKSGSRSYDVSVTIVDVDFQSSFLCGYLRIRGLTDDWPELTTYFDAQIIGSRYGFLTEDWGATETEDSTHWDRFPAYERVKPLMWGPKMNIPDGAGLGAIESDPSSSRSPVGNGEGGCVFMRWKERFLVPDHRVRDINGASFAGFYYVCVEFNPARSNVSLKRRRRKVDKRGSTREMDVPTTTTMRTEETQTQTQQTRQLDSLLSSNLNPNANANAKPPDTDVEMDDVLLDDGDDRGREERVFEGMDIEMNTNTSTDGSRLRESMTTPPSRSRSLIRGTTANHHSSQSHSRSRNRRRRRREEQQYDRYRMTAMQNAALGNNNNNTATPVAVPIPLSNSVSSSPSRPTSISRRDDTLYSQSLPVGMMVNHTADDNCDDSSMSYREWERIMIRERERERGREREYSRESGRERERGRMSERSSQLLPSPSSILPSFQHRTPPPTPPPPPPPPSQTVVQVQAHTRTVVEPESEDSESDYEYEYEYDESVYSDDPAFDDTLGSTPGGPYTATMSGYYFHQNSEPLS